MLFIPAVGGNGQLVLISKDTHIIHADRLLISVADTADAKKGSPRLDVKHF
jgi:hypothetical protein